MLLKCYIHYASKFGKSAVSTDGKCQFSFKSQRKATPKNLQTNVQLHFTCQQGNTQNPSSQASKVHKPRTSRCTSWIQKRQEPEIKLPTSVGSQRKQENFRKTSTSASWTTLKPLTVQITTNCRKFLKRWVGQGKKEPWKIKRTLEAHAREVFNHTLKLSVSNQDLIYSLRFNNTVIAC